MKIIGKNAKAEIVEKKSKFICNVYYIENKEEAEKIILNAKKTYHDARHNCYAYILYNTENNNIITKTSDDGEPSGTAGSPILNALKSKETVNTLAIVTRYFGGILLGTGGLVRAYNQATINALENTSLLNVELGYLASIEFDYTNAEKATYFFKKNNINIVHKEYLNNIKFILELNEENKRNLEEAFRDKNTKIDILCQKVIKVE